MSEANDSHKTPRTSVLVFEPLSGGHRWNFLAWLLEGIRSEKDSPVDFVFVIPESFIGADVTGVRYDPVSDTESAAIAADSWFKKRWRLWRLFRAKIREHNPDHILLMDLTQLEWALVLANCGRPLSAIDFVQVPEIPGTWKRQTKYLKLWLLLMRNRFCNLFLLNGSRSARILNCRFRKRCRFHAVPDPVWPVREIPRPRPGGGDGRIRFLYFGSISNRKGFDVLAEALCRLPPEDARNVELVIRGKPQHPEQYRETLRRLEALDTGLNLDVHAGHLSEEDLRRCFQEADVVLLPYRRPEYSSGVLAIAAREMRPVLGPAKGLLGRLIRTYRLGACVEMEAGPLSRALSESIQRPPCLDPLRAEIFTRRNRPERYACAILHAVWETLDGTHCDMTTKVAS